MISREEVMHIASLARIGTTEEEVALYQKELTSVLDFVDELTRVEEKQEKKDTLSRLTVPRSDKAHTIDETEKQLIIGNMPDTEGGALKVRSVL